MTAPTQETPVAKPASLYAQPGTIEIDASCRNPVLFLVTCGIVWLVLGAFLAVFASIKLHGPGLLANLPMLTYGRLDAAQSSIFLYGFASQVGMAVALWMIARMGRTFLLLPNTAIVAGMVWNLMVFLGVTSILLGGLTGFNYFQMPGWTSVGFFAAFALIGASALSTFHFRTERELYPSMWFLFAAFVWFPWILTTAGMLLNYFPIRATFQPVVAIWFANNFAMLWLGSIALAVIFYFVSKLSQQPLFGGSTAAFGFWFYVLFANALGFQSVSGLPNWMSAISSTASVLLLLPVVAFGISWLNTWKVRSKDKGSDQTARYISFSMFCFFAFIALNTISAFRPVYRTLGFTIFQPALEYLQLYGFCAMAILGAVHFMVPRLISVEWPRVGLGRNHFLLSALGIAMIVIGLGFGGLIQGSLWNDISIDFITTVRRTIPFIGIATLGLLLFFVAQLLLLWNLFGLCRACCANCCGLNNSTGAKR